MSQTNVVEMNVAELAQQNEHRATRLRKIASKQSRLAKQRARLEAQEAALTQEVESIMSGHARRGRPVGSKNAGKRGRPVGSKNVAKRGRAVSKTGEKLEDILLRVAPAHTAEPVSKDELVARVTKAGYKSAAADPKIVVGQALGRSKMFTAPARGLWQRSAKGDNAFASMNGEKQPQPKAKPVKKGKKETPKAETPAPEGETAHPQHQTSAA